MGFLFNNSFVNSVFPTPLPSETSTEKGCFSFHLSEEFKIGKKNFIKSRSQTSRDFVSFCYEAKCSRWYFKQLEHFEDVRQNITT